MATPIPENRVELTLTEIARVTGCETRTGTHSSVRGVTTDSRADVRGKLFVALEGEHFDGHAFIPEVVRAGAAAVLVSQNVDVGSDVAVLRVPSTLAALGSIAHHHRVRWGGRLVAVAGSAGKTTTKTAIAAALKSAGPVHAAAGNLNNLVGVPMVLLGLTAEHRFAVVEIGTNALGEVDRLASMAEPDVGVLTLVAIEHSEGLGDLDSIEEEEGQILRSLGPAHTAIANGDDVRAKRQLDGARAEIKLSYGTSQSADYRIVERRAMELSRSRVVIERPTKERFEVHTSLLGAPGALAVAAAFAVADHALGQAVSTEAVEAELLRIGSGEPGRLAPIELVDGSVVIDDTYNSNPASVRSATQAASEIAQARGARLVLVLGEMRELGALSVREHEGVGRSLAESGAAFCVAVSGDAAHIVESASIDAVFAPDCDTALGELERRVRPGDVILVKASRGVRAERIVLGLTRGKRRAT